ncbi:uncharacterized protein LOC116255020 isoform X2 [Nymphaea colorata]|uniref:uncharacterized protein LOC116255020 isoform X2 n=1 Tax=Nymphaea colorata TaxID=210225 RepID=UPI00129DCF65|nr:uncharacterized protein LOC116255020 isoform X2 [Nymphaea colorata]
MVTIAASLAASQWASLSSSSTGHLPAAPGQRLSARFVAPQLATDIIVVVEEVKFHLHKLPISPMDSNTRTQGETSNSMKGNKKARTSTTMTDDFFETIGTRW